MATTTARRLPLAPAALAGTVALGHFGTAATWLRPVRTHVFPALAGIGSPTHVALTLDDGPSPSSTPHFLDTLECLGARATFFVLGAEVQRHPRLCRRMVDRGHELAVHGWSHSWPWHPAPLRDVAEVRRTREVVRQVVGSQPLWYRPPYGVLTSSRWLAARRAGLRPVLWSAWAKDWRPDATGQSVLENAARHLRGGGTLLLHDGARASRTESWRATLAALPALDRYCRDRGWRLGPLAEHGVPTSPR